MEIKSVKILLTPELLADKDGARAAFKVAWDAFDKAGYEGCMDEEGNVPVRIFIGGTDEELHRYYLSLDNLQE